MTDKPDTPDASVTPDTRDTDAGRRPEAGTATATDTVNARTSDAVANAIQAARTAAHAAGLDIDGDDPADTGSTGTSGSTGSTGDTGGRGFHVPGGTRHARSGSSLTSFTFHLDGLGSAVRAGEIETALNALPGVQARVVYSTEMAWVTAPESLQPDILREVMTEYGVGSWLTDASLRRRSERLAAPGRRHISENRRRRQENYRASQETRRPRRRGSWLSGGQDGTEVLYTARALITVGRLLIAALLGIPVVAMQIVTPWQFDYWQWASLLLAIPVVTWCAWPFHRAMIAGLRRGMPALDAASSFAIILAFLFSAAVLVAGPAGERGWHSGNILTAWGYDGNALFLDVACGCTVLLLFGRLASRRTRLRSMLALNIVSPHVSGDGRGEMERKVTVVRRDRHGRPAKYTISTAEIRVGDDVLVYGGEIVPSDGEVVGGRAVLDAGPFGGIGGNGGNREGDGAGGNAGDGVARVGSRVFAGARHLGDATSEPLKVRVNKTGSRTRIAAVRRWIAAAERDENRLDQLATRTASLLVPWGTVIAAVAGLGWLIAGASLTAAIAVALTVLVAAAPVALAVSTTLSLRIGLARAAAGGTLLRNADTMNLLASIDAIIFNRAGTLTAGPMNVVGITAASGENSEMVLRVAGALSLESPHRVSRAIVRADRESRDSGAGGKDVPHWLEAGPVEVSEGGVFSAGIDLPDKDGESARQVRASLWRPRDLSELADPTLVNAALSGGTPLVVSWKGRPRGVITVVDTVKPDASEAVDALEESGVETFMMSRDTYRVARRMADSIGISTVLAGIAPNRKAAAVRSVHAHGSTVAMVGDQDVLDCLEVADVGVLMGAADHLDPGTPGGSGNRVAGSADMVLVREDISAIPEALNLARHVRTTVNGNLLFAWGYNIAALLLAAAGVLHPLLGTALMLGSSLLIEWRSARISHRDYTATAGVLGRSRYAGVSRARRP